MAQTFKSDQRTNDTAVPVVASRANERGGKKRVFYFKATLPGSGLAIGDDIDLVMIPAGHRIVGGEFSWNAASGAAATIAIGVVGTTGKYKAALVTNDATARPLAQTQAENFGDVLASDTIIKATNAVAAWVVSTILMGHIDTVLE